MKDLVNDKITLPTGSLSASQLIKWTRDKATYFDQYFHGEKPPETPSTLFGQRIADALETLHDTGEFPEDLTEKESEAICKLTFLDVAESRLCQDLGGVTCVGRVDTRSEDWSLVIDYKTGHKPWDHERVAASIQLKLYALMVWHLTGINPEMGIDWMETRQVESTSLIEPTGRVEKLRIRFSGEALDRFGRWVIDQAHDIARHYAAFRGELPGFDRGVLAEYVEAKRALDEAKHAERAAKEAYTQMFDKCGVRRYEYPEAGVFYSYVRRSWEYPEELRAMEEGLKIAKQAAQDGGAARCRESTVYVFRPKADAL